MGTALEGIVAELQARDYKVTPQRLLIIDTMLRHADRHLSVEDIHSLIRPEHPDIGLATIYRTLELLAALRFVTRIHLDDGRTRYELTRGTPHHHFHLMCLGCGSVEEFPEDILDPVERVVSGRSGFRITDHELKFYGYCAECQARKGDEG